jgi:tetratricopeptide (TPR) repeat protein
MRAKHSARSAVRPPEAKLPTRDSRNPLVALCLLLGLFTAVLYSPVGAHPFVNYDDPAYVTENPHVKAGLTWETFQWALTSTEASNWHPLTWLSHAADCDVFGVNPAGHHWDNVLLHMMNVMLLFLLLQQATGAIGKSLLVAALFAVHPLNVESVAWIAERKNVLSTMLFLLTLGAYGWYALRPGLRRFGLVSGLFLLGLMAKPMLVTLPFVLLLLDYWPLRRIAGRNSTLPASRFAPATFSRLIAEKVPLMALSAGSAVITLFAQRASLAPSERFPLSVRLSNAIYSYGMYLGKAFWPARLALFYPHSGNSLRDWQWIGAGLLLVAISVLAWKLASARPYLLVGWCWFLGTLLPVLGIVQVGAQAMADRYAYLPLIGIFVAVAWSVNLPVRLAGQVMMAAIALAALSFLTWRQIGYWKTNYDLWSHTLAVTGNNLVAEDKLGSTLQAMGQQDAAMFHFSNAARLDPLDPLSNFSIGADLHWHGHLQEAIPHYEIAVEHSTDARLRADAYQNLGTDYLQLGDPVRARENFLRALEENPGLVTAFAGLGEVAGEPARTLSQNVVERPTGEGYLQLGRALQQGGRLSDARLAYAEALALNPALVEAQREIAALQALPSQ